MATVVINGAAVPDTGGVTLISQNGRRWTFPAVPPEADHEFPTAIFNEVTRPDASPVNVLVGSSLHKISMNWVLAYPDGRSIEPDLQALRGFASDGKWFTMSYTPSWGGWWLIGDILKVSQKYENEANEIIQATVTMVLKRATELSVELTPIKALNASDVPIIKTVEVAGTSGDSFNPDTAPFQSGGGTPSTETNAGVISGVIGWLGNLIPK